MTENGSFERFSGRYLFFYCFIIDIYPIKKLNYKFIISKKKQLVIENIQKMEERSKKYIGKCWNCCAFAVYESRYVNFECDNCGNGDFTCSNNCNKKIYFATKCIDDKLFCGRCSRKQKQKKSVKLFTCYGCENEFEFGKGIISENDEDESRFGLCSGCIIPKVMELYAKSEFEKLKTISDKK